MQKLSLALLCILPLLLLVQSNPIIQLQNIDTDYTIRAQNDIVQVSETYSLFYSSDSNSVDKLKFPIFKKSIFCENPQITLVDVTDGVHKLSATTLPSTETAVFKFIEVQQSLNMSQPLHQIITIDFTMGCILDSIGSKVIYYKNSKGFPDYEFSSTFNATLKIHFIDTNFTKEQIKSDPQYPSTLSNNQIVYSQVIPKEVAEGEKEILITTVFPSIFGPSHHFIGNLMIVIILAVICIIIAVVIVGVIVGFYFYRKKKLESNPRLQDEENYENL